MFSRSVRRVAIESPWRVPPTFLLPMRARLHTTQQFVEPNPPPPNTSTPAGARTTQDIRVSPSSASVQSKQQTASSQSPADPTNTAQSSLSTTDAPLSQSVTELLPSLASQPPHYATIHIHARAYMVTEGDQVTLPFHMPKVSPGDILRLNRASLIGSRDFTLQGQPYVDDRLFECRAVVMGVETEPMRFKEKTKRRNRRIKTVRSKHYFTRIAIQQLRVKQLDEV